MWEGIVWEFGDGHVHTTVFIVEKRQGCTVQYIYHVPCHVAAWKGGEFGGEWICV